MSDADEATVNPDGSTTFESADGTGDDAGAGSAGYDDAGDGGAGQDEGFEMPPMDDAADAVKGGIDPAFYFIAAVIAVVVLYYFFVVKKKEEEVEDDFFSNLDGEKFNLSLPDEVDEYYKIRAKCEEAGWEPGKPPPGGAQGANAQGPHRVLAQALMKRAIADIPLVMHIQKESAGMSRLYSKSMCSVKQWRAYQAAESLVSTEINEVKTEADEIEPGWSEVIWRQATQYHQMLKKKHEMEAAAAQEKARQMEVASSKPAVSGKVDDAKAKEAAAAKIAEELIKEEEKEKQKKNAFATGVKKGFLENKGKKK